MYAVNFMQTIPVDGRYSVICRMTLCKDIANIKNWVINEIEEILADEDYKPWHNGEISEYKEFCEDWFKGVWRPANYPFEVDYIHTETGKTYELKMKDIIEEVLKRLQDRPDNER